MNDSEQETLKPMTKPTTAPTKPGVDARRVAWLALAEGLRGEGGGAQEALERSAGEAGLSARDKALSYEIMMGVLRERRVLDAALRSLAGFSFTALEEGLQDFARLGAYQILFLDRVPIYAAVDATVGATRRELGARAAGYCNAVLKDLARVFPAGKSSLAWLCEKMDLEERYSMPGWLARLVKRQYGKENLVEALRRMNQPLPIYGRINVNVHGQKVGEAAVREDEVAAREGEVGARENEIAARENVLKDLREVGIEAVDAGDLARWCIRLGGSAGSVAQSVPFQRGELILQDASAQLVSELVGAQPGMTAIDFCAAPGGKTTYMARAMGGKGRLIACEVSARRVGRLRENIERLGYGEFAEVHPLKEHLSADSIRKELALGEGADRVLVDAPCSGLGTLRRHPEIRWRMKKADLARLAEMELPILEKASALAKVGGVVVYATCSFADEENAQVVQAFLEKWRGEFEIVTSTDGLDERLAGHVGEDGWFRALPHLDEMDSASAVRLMRMR